MRLLLATEDPASLDRLRSRLEGEGIEVIQTTTSEEMMLLAEEAAPDIAVLDSMLADATGLDGCGRLRRIKAIAHLPIIILADCGNEKDRVRSLEAGADDYVTKPFSPLELVARIETVLRRVRPALVDALLRYADLEMDVARYRVRRQGIPIALRPTEFRLLRHFLEHPGHVFSRERLLNLIWKRECGIDIRTVDVHIRRLRKAINIAGTRNLIRTVRAAGYSLDEE